MNFLAIKLQTHKLAEQRAFYSNTLGLSVVDSSADTVSLQAGATRLTFQQGEPACYHFAFNIPRNQFDAAKAWLKQRAELLIWDDADYIHWEAWNAHATYCLDPAGNVIELIARHNLPNDRDLPFSSAHLLSVSEIGLAADNVGKLVSALQMQADVPVWDAGDGEIFTAMGDDHGLFIIVRRGRAWFPTDDKQADFAPVHITMRGTKTQILELADLPYQITIQG